MSINVQRKLIFKFYIMEKLFLNRFSLETNDLLQKDQLKEILGGNTLMHEGSCTATCKNGSTISCSGSTTSCNDAKGEVDGSCENGDGTTNNC